MAHLLFTTGNLLSGTHTITPTNKLPLIRKYAVNRRFKFSSHLGQFFGGCIFILSAAAVCAAITVNVHYQDPEDKYTEHREGDISKRNRTIRNGENKATRQ